MLFQLFTVRTDKLFMNATYLVVASLLTTSLFASAPNAPPTQTGQRMVYWSPADKLPKWLHVAGQIRGRWEVPSGTSLTSNAQDGYYASRLRFTVGVQPTSWLRFGFEAQDARTAGYNLPRAPTTLYDP